MNPKISIILPVYNEEKNLEQLHKELNTVLQNNYKEWEVIYIDDGSTDNSYQKLKQIHKNYENVKIIKFKGNFGQSPAIEAGINHAQGKIIVPMDSDLQNDPKDIPRLVDKLNEGYDCVSGNRKNRHDPIAKRFCSWIAMHLRRIFLNTKLHDYGCTLKSIDSEAAKSIDIRGELHRYIPPLLKWKGYKTTEIEVNHRKRKHGNTSYSWQRIPKGFMDMINVWFWQKFSQRPLHIFGGLGILSGLIGGIGGLYTVYLKLIRNVSLSDTALPLFSVFMVMIGVQFFISGILADISIKNYQKNTKNYNIQKTLNKNKE